MSGRRDAELAGAARLAALERALRELRHENYALRQRNLLLEAKFSRYGITHVLLLEDRDELQIEFPELTEAII